jgi:hypothetical protein
LGDSDASVNAPASRRCCRSAAGGSGGGRGRRRAPDRPMSDRPASVARSPVARTWRLLPPGGFAGGRAVVERAGAGVARARARPGPRSRRSPSWEAASRGSCSTGARHEH